MKYRVFIILFAFCQLSVAQSKSGYVKVISATTQDWISGAAPGRSGTTCNIKVMILTDRVVTFKNLWIGKEHADFELQTYFRDPYRKPAKGDSVLLYYVKIYKQPNQSIESNPLPFQYKGEALVEFVVNGKPRYFVIRKLTKLSIAKGE